MNKIGINLLVFKNDLDNGISQEEILNEIANFRRFYCRNKKGIS